MSTKIGVIINNIGSPASHNARDVGIYLTQFLMDPAVIKLPWFWRTLLVRGLIVPFRSRSSAKKYQSIWQPTGAPLLVNTANFCAQIQRALGPQFQVEMGMNFGLPSIETAVEKLRDCRHVLFCPMFPQYDASTSGAATEKFAAVIAEQGYGNTVSVLSPFFQEHFFLQSFVRQIQISGPEDYVLFSFHGLPEKYVGVYKDQCHQTAARIAHAAGLKALQWSVSFQSRLGPTKWLGPYTIDEIKRLAGKGKNIILASPAFVADCLETLEELGIEARKAYSEVRPEGSFHLLSCPNDQSAWVEGFAAHIVSMMNMERERSVGLEPQPVL